MTTPPNTSPPIATPPVTAAGGPTTTAAGAPTGGGPGGSGGPGGPGGGSAGDDAGGGPRGFLPFTGSDVRGVALLGAAAVAIGRAMTKARNRVPWLALDDDAPSNGEPTQHD
ncbi:MAG: hypothetical protein M5T61_05700 [Acidimicrobiia bacterium]|nr:hypothetical protein [Acidimicrobiia bacterium]